MRGGVRGGRQGRGGISRSVALPPVQMQAGAGRRPWMQACRGRVDAPGRRRRRRGLSLQAAGSGGSGISQVSWSKQAAGAGRRGHKHGCSQQSLLGPHALLLRARASVPAWHPWQLGCSCCCWAPHAGARVGASTAPWVPAWAPWVQVPPLVPLLALPSGRPWEPQLGLLPRLALPAHRCWCCGCRGRPGSGWS
jgi:hypothetical protein